MTYISDLRSIFVRLSHPVKAYSPHLHKAPGQGETDLSLLQVAKAVALISLTPSGITISSRFLHPSKARFPITANSLRNGHTLPVSAVPGSVLRSPL